MSERIQNQKEEERVVSKSRPAVMGMSSYLMSSSSSAASSPIASKKDRGCLELRGDSVAG